MSLFTAIVSVTATAFPLDYVTHPEWGLSLIVIRRDDLDVAASITVVMIIMALLQRKRIEFHNRRVALWRHEVGLGGPSARDQCCLIKRATNGMSLRAVHGYIGDSLIVT
jgi:hypothetical protein